MINQEKTFLKAKTLGMPIKRSEMMQGAKHLYTTYCYWKSKLRSSTQAEVIFEELEETSSSTIELLLPGEFNIWEIGQCRYLF